MPTVRCPEHFGGLLRCRLRAPCTAGSGACRSARRPISVLDRQAQPPAATTARRSKARTPTRGTAVAGQAWRAPISGGAQPSLPGRRRAHTFAFNESRGRQRATQHRHALSQRTQRTPHLVDRTQLRIRRASSRLSKCAPPGRPGRTARRGSGAGISTSMARSSAAVARARLSRWAATWPLASARRWRSGGGTPPWRARGWLKRSMAVASARCSSAAWRSTAVGIAVAQRRAEGSQVALDRVERGLERVGRPARRRVSG